MKPSIYLPNRRRKLSQSLKTTRHAFSVHYKTQLCDKDGKVIRDLQEGWNMITDFGMNEMAGKRVPTLFDYLVLSSATETLKRVAAGEELTIDYSGGAADIDISTDTNFFESDDNADGRTLKIDGFPEMLIDGYTDQQNIHCTARGGVWPEGFNPATPGTGPHTGFGVHYTNKATLGTYFTQFNTYDTAEPNYDAEINDPSNDRTYHQRIFLSGVVSGAPWNVNQLGWSDGNGSHNCTGKTNLGVTDAVPIGNRYRVTLTVYSVRNPIEITGQVINWGSTVGSHTCDIVTERIGRDKNSGGGQSWNFLSPYIELANRGGWWTGAFTLDTPQYEGEAGYVGVGRTGGSNVASVISDNSYTSNTHRRVRNLIWTDTLNIASATGLYGGGQPNWPWISLRPQSGTITKPTGYIIELAFPITWQRTLTN